MRCAPWFEPPPVQMLLELPVHVVVRDYPELLAVLRRLGVDLGTSGAEPLSAVAPVDPPALEAALVDALAWRTGNTAHD